MSKFEIKKNKLRDFFAIQNAKNTCDLFYRVCYIIDEKVDTLTMSAIWTNFYYILCVHGSSFGIIINCSF